MERISPAELRPRIDSFIQNVAREDADEMLLAVELSQLSTALQSIDPMENLKLLATIMAEADQASTSSAWQIYQRDVVTRIATLVAYRSKIPPAGLQNCIRELRRLQTADGRDERLRSGIETFEQLREQFKEFDERLSWQEQIGSWQYSMALRHCLDRADSTPDPTQRAYWEAAAWHQAHSSKGRILREQLGAGPREVPGPEEIIAQLRVLVPNSKEERPLLIEYYLVNDSEVAAFLVPLWQESTLKVVRREFKPGMLRRVAQEWHHAIHQLEELKVRQNIEGQPEQAHLMTLLDELGMVLFPLEDVWDSWKPTSLIVSPHRWLNLLPLAAITWNGTPLGTSIPVHVLPTPALAIELSQRPRLEAPGTALVVGYGTLRCEVETEIVQGIVHAAGWESENYTGSSATRLDVLRQATGVSLLHCAAHARLESSNFLGSGIELSDDRLTVQDVMSTMRLGPNAIVFLASCDTARVLPTETDELMALARAFLLAGAGTIIATLWRSDDRVGVAFAKAFYLNLVSGRKTLGEAYRAALQKMFNLHPTAPYFWAVPILMVGLSPFVVREGGVSLNED